MITGQAECGTTQKPTSCFKPQILRHLRYHNQKRDGIPKLHNTKVSFILQKMDVTFMVWLMRLALMVACCIGIIKSCLNTISKPILILALEKKKIRTL